MDVDEISENFEKDEDMEESESSSDDNEEVDDDQDITKEDQNEPEEDPKAYLPGELNQKFGYSRKIETSSFLFKQ